MDEAAAPSHQAGSRGFIFDTSFPTQAPSPDSSGMPPHLHTHYHGLNRATIKPGLDACKLLAPPAGLPSCPHHHHPQSPDSATTRALSENNADYTHPLPKNTSQLLVSVARILRLPPKGLLGSGRRSVPHSLPFAHCLHSTHARHLPGHGAPVPSCCPHAVSSAAVPSPSSTCQNPVYPLKPDLHVLLSLPPAGLHLCGGPDRASTCWPVSLFCGTWSSLWEGRATWSCLRPLSTTSSVQRRACARHARRRNCT